MHHLTGIGLATLLAAAPLHAQAAAPRPDDRSGRYSITETAQGYLRLDTATGELTHCIVDEFGAWKCLIVPDDRDRYRREIEGLESVNDFLKARQRALETRLVELEETLIELREHIGRPEGDASDDLSETDRGRLREAVDLADAMAARLSALLRGLRDEAGELAKKVPGLRE